MQSRQKELPLGLTGSFPSFEWLHKHLWEENKVCVLMCSTQGLTQFGEFGIIHWPRHVGFLSVWKMEKCLSRLGLLCSAVAGLALGLCLLSKLEMLGLLGWFKGFSVQDDHIHQDLTTKNVILPKSPLSWSLKMYWLIKSGYSLLNMTEFESTKYDRVCLTEPFPL